MIPALAAGLCLAFTPSIHADDEKEPASTESAAEADDDSEAHSDSDSDEGHEEADHGDGTHEAAHAEDDHGDHGGEAHADSHASSPDPLATDPDLALWTAGVFFLMLAILSQLAWKPIMEGLKAREDNIAGNLAAADAKHEEAKALLAEHESKLAGAAEQVRELLAEAHRDAEVTMAQAKADAKSEFEAERQRATRDIEQATDAAVRQLAEKTAGLAIDLAGQVVKKDITSDRQNEIVREALGRFGSSDPSAN